MSRNGAMANHVQAIEDLGELVEDDQLAAVMESIASCGPQGLDRVQFLQIQLG